MYLCVYMLNQFPDVRSGKKLVVLDLPAHLCRECAKICYIYATGGPVFFEDVAYIPGGS